MIMNEIFVERVWNILKLKSKLNVQNHLLFFYFFIFFFTIFPYRATMVADIFNQPQPPSTLTAMKKMFQKSLQFIANKE